MNSKRSFIDLFCGCGGFTLGMMRAGFSCEAAIDSNKEAIGVLKDNLQEVKCCLHEDLTKFTPEELAAKIGKKSIDIIVGGPPCQGFSTARQADGANHGNRLVEDSRRYLFRHFLEYVKYFKPAIFVMENVRGIKTAGNGTYYKKILEEIAAIDDYHLFSTDENAWDLGAPQKRIRHLLFGFNTKKTNTRELRLFPPPRAILRPTLGVCIGDLPVLVAGQGEESGPYDMEKRETHKKNHGYMAENYLNNVLEIEKAGNVLTSHVARRHSDRDLGDFKKLLEGEHSGEAQDKRGIEFDFPYDKTVFRDRYKRQHRDEPCSTIVAHLSRDGLMFIHPTQNRTLTVREAARIQGFPDWYRFFVARTHQFRLIGNAVSPLVSEAIGISFLEMLNKK